MTRPTRTYHIIRQKRSPAGWQTIDFDASLDEILSQPFKGRYALIERSQRRSTVPKQRLITISKIITTGSDLTNIQRVKAKLEAKAQP